MTLLKALPPLALYVHIPWCVRKCPYCDFNSHERAAPLPEAEYVARLLADLEELLPSVWGRRLVSMFIGGGTPSLFTPDAIDTLLSGVRARMTLEPGAEITLEANPGTVEAARFRGYRQAGVNRISIGIQSFDERMLAALGRIHGPDEGRRALAAALETFDTVNIDLMYGLPGQTLAMARADIEEGAKSGVPHLSAYQLTIEPNTVFFSKPPELPAHDATADMQEMVEEVLGAAGYEHYETSAFAQRGHRCRHNLNYWEFGDYLGIGAGAHGKLSFPDRITRHERAKQPDMYLRGTTLELRPVKDGDLPFEFMLNALRLVEGFPVALFEERTGLSALSIEPALARAEKAGLIERDWRRVRPTARGQRFLNELLHLFLAGETGGRAPGGRGAGRAIRISSSAAR
jgi:putative oxygen-independent coproporphyrinogen III oxidase